MPKQKSSAQLMRDFANQLNELYYFAEVLRDHADGRDKDIFNKVRGALYDLKDDARYQADRWEVGQYA